MGPVKLPFADSDLVPLVKRYSSSTIVTMLREIAKCKSVKLDWVKLCKGTSTGITNPREYQALWRSIAYRADLDDSFDGNDSPLEDDSDIEVDLDPVPSVSPAVAESISSFVKADLQQYELEEARMGKNAAQTGVSHQAGDLATARLQQGSGLLGKSDGSAANARGLPYLASATQCAATHGESTAALTGTKVPFPGAAMNQSDRKRRRLWTPEEDLALIAAVDKCGEGNWTTVLKNHYDFDRSASQLSQRWALIRKRREVQEKAGYGIGSGVSPLASGYKDLRPEALKSGTLAAGSGSHVGTPKDAGKSGNVPMSIKQPLSSTSSVPVSKRIPAASVPTGTETTTSASVLETQRQRALPASGVSSSWAGVRPQAHGQSSMRGSVTAGVGQAHKGATPEGSHGQGVRRVGAQGPSIGSQMYYTSTQSGTSTIPIDSKYAALRNMGAGVARGGGSKGVHGPDPMIQAAAMAAGARIAPASAAASLLKAAQSGNVVHIGSGGLPRSKLGLTSQAGSGNAGGNPGIVHYIRTGSGGAATSSNLQRTSSHHLGKNQSNRSFGSNSGSQSAGNSSPLSVPTVPAQGPRNNHPQAPVQSSKPASLSKRGSSPQQKSASASNLTSTPSPNPSSTTPTPIMSTPAAPSSTATSVPNSTPTPAPTPATKSTSTPAPTPVSTSTSAPGPTPTATPVKSSTSTPKATLALTPKSTPVLTPKSASTSTPATSTSKSVPGSTLLSTSASTSVSDPASTSISTSILASISTSISATISAPVSSPASAPGSAPVSTRVLAPVSSPASAPGLAPVSARVSAPVSTPAAAPGSAPVSARVSAPVSAPVSASASAPVSVPVSAPLSSLASASVSAPVSAPVPKPNSTPAPTSAPIPACGFNTAIPEVDSPGEGTT